MNAGMLLQSEGAGDDIRYVLFAQQAQDFAKKMFLFRRKRHRLRGGFGYDDALTFGHEVPSLRIFVRRRHSVPGLLRSVLSCLLALEQPSRFAFELLRE